LYKKCPICYSKIEIIEEEHVKIYQDSPKKTAVKKTYVTRIIDFRCPVCKSNVPDSEAEKCPICKSKIKGMIQVKKEILKGHYYKSSKIEKLNSTQPHPPIQDQIPKYQPSSGKFCTNCGSKISPTANFCTSYC